MIIDVVAKGLLYYIKIYMSSSLIFMGSPILTEFNSVAYTSIMLEILTEVIERRDKTVKPFSRATLTGESLL